MPAKSETAKRGQDNDSIEAYPLIASNATPPIARPIRQLLHFACDFAIESVGGLYGLRAGAPSRQAARALTISAPEALAGKPHDEQELANGSFGSSQAKQRQRYDCCFFMMANVELTHTKCGRRVTCYIFQECSLGSHSL
jgi:hypothetical protein